jgi:hypothetical protein
MLIPTLFYVSLLHSLVARATIRQMLGTSLASNGMLKPDISTQGGSIFVATYGGSETKSEGDVKERDLESGEVVVPAQVGFLFPDLILIQVGLLMIVLSKGCFAYLSFFPEEPHFLRDAEPVFIQIGTRRGNTILRVFSICQ